MNVSRLRAWFCESCRKMTKKEIYPSLEIVHCTSILLAVLSNKSYTIDVICMWICFYRHIIITIIISV